MPPSAITLEGKSALILGASRGIGEALARAFHAHGASVMLASRDIETLEKIAAELDSSRATARATFADMLDAESLEHAVSETIKAFGKLDAAVNNSGVQLPRIPFTELTDENFDHVINVNLRGVFLAMRPQIKAMLESGGGSIVNISSSGGLVGIPLIAPYVASKHGVVGLTKAAAVEFASRKIRVSALAPGTTMTEMFKNTPAATPEGLAAMLSKVPMGRIAQPDEITGAAIWLCSDASTYVTGIALPVDAGFVAI